MALIAAAAEESATRTEFSRTDGDVTRTVSGPCRRLTSRPVVGRWIAPR